jgi:DNA-directed RNA polymerase II subunit RPB1
MEEEEFDYINEVVQEVKDESCPTLFINRRDARLLDRIIRITDEDLPTVAIESSLITVFDQDEIPKFAVPITSDKDEGPETLNDPRLGSTGPDQLCSRCGRNNYSCPGHFGYITLSIPIIHPLFVNVVFNVLKSICLECRSTLLSEEYIMHKFGNLSGLDRLRAIAENSIQQCSKCESVNYNFDEANFRETKKITYILSDKHIEYPISKIIKVFEELSPRVVELLGFQNGAHPKNLILRYLLVLPPCDRPQAIIAGKIQPEKDKLTKAYQNIIRINSNIAKEPENSPGRDKLIRTLYEKIEELIDSSDNSNLASSKDRKISIKQRIQGKEALIRGAIMGKKVNYFGRTVLSADPSLKYGQISIPLEWQSILTKPEVVTSFNKDYLQELLNQGKISYIIKRKEKYRGKILIRNDDRQKIKLEIGDVVDRWIENGDYVLFGRHPTLHKQSMMGYEVILKPQRTIGFNPSFAAPHNLDFDGDEGNVHVPQTLEADVEIQEIANAKYCIMNAQSNNPVVGISYDALSGAYLLTQDSTEIEEELFMDMANLISCKENFGSLEKRMEQLKRPYKIFKGYKEYKVYEEPEVSEEVIELIQGVDDVSEVKRKKKRSETKSESKSEELRKVHIPVYHYTGKAAFSLLLPPDFYYSKGKVTIIQGVLYEGEITKDHVGESHNSIVQAIYKDYGPGRAADFLSDTVFLVNRWLQSVSLTVSIKDCTIQDKTIESKLNTEYQFTIGQVESILGRGQIINPIEKERQEKQVIAQLQDYKTKVGKQIQQGLSPDNTFSIMVNSKSKGNEVYIAQIIGSLGQQFIINKRAPLTISDGRRCIPYFNEDDLDPRSRGFCVSSFMKGLSPAELFFHQAASREGILDTAIKTSDTGTIFRRLVKSLENLVVSEDLSVRILDKKIIQFQYGEDGFNPEALEFVQTKSGRFLSFINLKRVASKLNRKYGFIDVKQEVLEDTISYVPKESERLFEEEYEEDMEED